MKVSDKRATWCERQIGAFTKDGRRKVLVEGRSRAKVKRVAVRCTCGRSATATSLRRLAKGSGGLVTHDCTDCGRRFGGTSAYSRHLDRRRDRCRTDTELRRRGLVLTDGIWRRRPPTGETGVLPSMRRRAGSTALEDRSRVPDTREGLRAAPDVTPQQKNGGSG